MSNVRCLVLSMGLFLAACGDGSDTQSSGNNVVQIQTTAQERGKLAGIGLFSSLAVSAYLRDILGSTKEIPISYSFKCMNDDGKMRITGTAKNTGNPEDIKAKFETAVTPDNCNADNDEKIIANGGSVDVEGTFKASDQSASATITFEMHTNGTIQVKGLEQGAGNCTYNTTEKLIINLKSDKATIEVNGTVCGEKMELSETDSIARAKNLLKQGFKH